MGEIQTTQEKGMRKTLAEIKAEKVEELLKILDGKSPEEAEKVYCPELVPSWWTDWTGIPFPYPGGKPYYRNGTLWY